ncbi:gas vesicle protein GvpG [Plantactinospora siamensis]|uniref:Gas vesicle protein GvpG n=1 Tax=Plantactinospora siamensis TaxID=555372 RepID=A0ABV6NWA2_9ACTN
MLLGLPLAPLRGVTALAGVLQEQAEQQLYDPATAWQQLEELDRAAAAGELSGAELEDAQQQIIDRLIA